MGFNCFRIYTHIIIRTESYRGNMQVCDIGLFISRARPYSTHRSRCLYWILCYSRIFRRMNLMSVWRQLSQMCLYNAIGFHPLILILFYRLYHYLYETAPTVLPKTTRLYGSEKKKKRL